MKFPKDVLIEVTDFELAEWLEAYACRLLNIDYVGGMSGRLLSANSQDTVYLNGDYFGADAEDAKNPEAAAIIRAIDVIRKHRFNQGPVL